MTPGSPVRPARPSAISATITVVAPPEILSQTSDMLVYPGDSARLFVTVATGARAFPPQLPGSRRSLYWTPPGPSWICPGQRVDRRQYIAEVVTSAGCPELSHHHHALKCPKTSWQDDKNAKAEKARLCVENSLSSTGTVRGLKCLPDASRARVRALLWTPVDTRARLIAANESPRCSDAARRVERRESPR